MPNVRIVREDYPTNPRKDYEHLGLMVCWHRRYRLGDEQPKCDPDEWEPPAPSITLSLYLYDHSGITMSTTPFSCPWDSGQVGWICLPWDVARKEFTGTDDEIEEKAIACLKAEVEEYSAYLEGEVYGYSVTDDDGNEIDSCWGFYGYDAACEAAKEVCDV